MPVCRSLLPNQVYWTEMKGCRMSLANSFSHRLGRACVSAFSLAAQEA